MSDVKNHAAVNSASLRSYYFLRAGFSVIWIAAAVLVGKDVPVVGAGLLVVYPLWDALANLIDARQSGGLARSPSQSFNAAVSAVTAVAVAYALAIGPHAALGVFGAWAILAGVSQLATGVRRWSAGAQWAMILSGAQSTLVGGFLIKQATGTMPAGIMDVVPYAAFGAFYFLVSAVWLMVKQSRKSTPLIA